MADLTAKRLREVLRYDQLTGEFTALLASPRRPAGAKVRRINKDGYLCAAIDGRTYAAHRLAWLYVYGAWPDDILDHKNRVRTDNRIDNLRQATRSINVQNSTVPATKKTISGLQGVCRRPNRYKSRPWIARIIVDGQWIRLGYFTAREDAYAAYLAAKSVYHPGFIPEADPLCVPVVSAPVAKPEGEGA
jgi:hypothetical protein